MQLALGATHAAPFAAPSDETLGVVAQKPPLQVAEQQSKPCAHWVPSAPHATGGATLASVAEVPRAPLSPVVPLGDASIPPSPDWKFYPAPQWVVAVPSPTRKKAVAIADIVFGCAIPVQTRSALGRIQLFFGFLARVP